MFDLVFQLAHSLRAPGEHRDRVAAASESAGHRGSGARTYSGDQGDWAIVRHRLLPFGATMRGAKAIAILAASGYFVLTTVVINRARS
ncbi:MAG: hypothetical protein ABIR79_05180 [Candidatus Binatia bacterium]